jgi:hypothetical protein
VALLEHEVELKVQHLAEVRESKESFETQLAGIAQNLVQSRAESNKLQGRLVEIERTYSARYAYMDSSLDVV